MRAGRIVSWAQCAQAQQQLMGRDSGSAIPTRSRVEADSRLLERIVEYEAMRWEFGRPLPDAAGLATAEELPPPEDLEETAERFLIADVALGRRRWTVCHAKTRLNLSFSRADWVDRIGNFVHTTAAARFLPICHDPFHWYAAEEAAVRARVS